MARERGGVGAWEENHRSESESESEPEINSFFLDRINRINRIFWIWIVTLIL